MERDRRSTHRISVEFPVTQFVDNHPIVSLVSNLSDSGLHACHVVEPMARSSKQVQLEFSLPGTDEPLWVKGEIIYDTIGLMYHGTGIRFVAMAPAHRAVLSDWLQRHTVPPPTSQTSCSSRSLRV